MCPLEHPGAPVCPGHGGQLGGVQRGTNTPNVHVLRLLTQAPPSHVFFFFSKQRTSNPPRARFFSYAPSSPDGTSPPPTGRVRPQSMVLPSTLQGDDGDRGSPSAIEFAVALRVASVSVEEAEPGCCRDLRRWRRDAQIDRGDLGQQRWRGPRPPYDNTGEPGKISPSHVVPTAH